MGTLSFDQVFKVLGVIGTLGGFIWSVHVWQDKVRDDRAAVQREQIRTSETRHIEASKPFLDRQLALYMDAIQTVETIATSQNKAEVDKSTVQFWRLYWGELALVEDREVEAAMKALGQALDNSKNQNELSRLSLDLAHACRTSLDRSWGIHAWTQDSTVEEHPTRP